MSKEDNDVIPHDLRKEFLEALDRVWASNEATQFHQWPPGKGGSCFIGKTFRIDRERGFVEIEGGGDE